MANRFNTRIDGGLLARLLIGLVDGSTTVAALTGTIRNMTTPTKADGATGAIEVNETGGAFGDLALAHNRPLVLPVAGSVTIPLDLTEGPCSGVSCHTADVVVYGQLRESPDLVYSRVPVGWTLGAGWSQVGATSSVIHASGGGTADLKLAVHATFPLLVGVPYYVGYTIAGQTAGTLTEKIGTAAGSARAASGTFAIALLAAGTGELIFTPTDLFDGSVDLASIFVFPAYLLPTSGVADFAFKRIVATATKAARTTLVASPGTHLIEAWWYRRPGHVEV